MAWRLPILTPSFVCTPPSGAGGPWPFALASFVEGTESKTSFGACDRGELDMGRRVCEE